MKLSDLLHKHITTGRKGKSDSSEAVPTKLTDEQLCAMWSKATDLESAIILLQRDIRELSNRKIDLNM